jgi:hypothetical protein
MLLSSGEKKKTELMKRRVAEDAEGYASQKRCDLSDLDRESGQEESASILESATSKPTRTRCLIVHFPRQYEWRTASVIENELKWRSSQ